MYKTTQKSAFIKSFWIIMRAFLFLAICFSTGASLLAIEGKSQDLHEISVVLSSGEATLEQVFNNLERQSGYTFSYASDVRQVVVKNAPTNVTDLASLLELLSEEYKLQFDVFDRIIAVNLLTAQRSGKIAGRVADHTGNALP